MKIRFLLIGPLVLVGVAAVGLSFYTLHSTERDRAEAFRVKDTVVPNDVIERETISDLVVGKGTSLAELLSDNDIASDVTASVIAAARPVFDLRRLREGNRLTLRFTPDRQLLSLLYNIDPDHELWVERAGEKYQANLRQIPSTTNVVAIAGEIHGSLFQGIVDAGERPELAVRLAEIFAYDLDFYTDPKPGDTFRVVMERRDYGKDQPAGYGRILAAEYRNEGRNYRAVLFHDTNGSPAYYSADGKSLQKAFLRSPLKFAARVSSHFTVRRFHPVLKIYRPHLGTDYAAPTGTPVQSIASGKVLVSNLQGGGGNVVEIRHDNGYVSYYMHLSRRLVRTGQRVEQGQRIGLVGATGLATGPHLDFRLRRNGQFVNFERMHLPPAHPVPASQMAEFVAERERWLPMLENAQVAVNKEDVNSTGRP